MENRRQPGEYPAKTFNRVKVYRKPEERFQQGPRSYQPRDDRNRPPNERFQSNNNDNRFQPRENRFQPRDDRFQPRDNRYPPRDDRPRDDRPRDDRPATGGGRFQPRDSNFRGRDDRFQGRDNRPSTGQSDRFQPRKPFAPRGKTFTPAWKLQEPPRVYDEMQVTDGKHRGKFLQTTASARTRPTVRKVREVLFRVLQRKIRAQRFLDLCAGSGTIGIEAISRGALIATFVERSSKMCGYIKKNLHTLGIKEGHGEICEMEALPFLKKMQKRRRFWDVVFFDPPFDTNYDEVLNMFSRGVAIRPGGILVLEHHTEMFFPEKIGILKRLRVVNQGDTSLSFYEKG